MKIVINLCLAALSLFSLSSFGQSLAASTTTTGSATQAVQLLQKALAALSPNATTRDTTLSGSVHHISGAIDENGTASLQAISAGASKLVLNLPSGQFTEVRDLTATPAAGHWSGSDGVTNPIASHNLLNEPSWFSPVAIVSRLVLSPSSVAILVGTEELGTQSVQHISVYQVPPATLALPDSYPHLTQVDLYLDSSTFLPAAVRYDIHPDDNESADIPIEVDFSDYRAVQGTQVPYHVQRLINNGLVFDIQVDSVTLNTGLSPTSFTVSSR
jgi:hypothetical protein